MSDLAGLDCEELIGILGAVRAVARASGPLDFTWILQTVFAQLLDVLEADQAAIYLLDATRKKLVWAGANPPAAEMKAEWEELSLEGTFTGKVVAGRSAVAFPVTSLGAAGVVLHSLGLNFIAIVPLYVQEGACGVVHLGRKARPFDERELRVAEVVGELLVVYLENARLYADAQARLEETAMLLDVARSITASLDLRLRLIASADGVARVVGVSNAFVILLEGDPQELVITQTDSNWTGPALGYRIQAESAARHAVRERKAILVEDAQSSPLVHRELVERFEIKSVLALPLLVGHQAIGAVVAIERRHPRTWSAAQVQRGEVIAHQIAIAVAHARLYEEVKRSYDELGRTQAELVKRERLAALGQLAATLAHEVRNPLGVLFNSISTLSKSLPRDDDAVTLLRIMDEEAQRLERLVRELLEFVRPVTPDLEDESLHALVEDALDAAAREVGAGGASLVNEVSPSLPKFRVDARMLRRALLNLIVNGAQAAGSGGRVVVRAESETEAGARLVRIEITDTGEGIRPEVIPRIFDPFFTTKATGTGLGLAIVKEIVEAHRGEIRVESVKGRGTTLALVLPELGDAEER